MVHKIYNQLDGKEIMSSDNINELNKLLASADKLTINGTDHEVANGNLKLVYDAVVKSLGNWWSANHHLPQSKKKQIIKYVICREIDIDCSEPTTVNGGKKKRSKSRRKNSSKKKLKKKRKTKRRKPKH